MFGENSASCDIKNFREFLEKCLKQTVLEFRIKSLTAPGENYGSIARSVDVKLAQSIDSLEDDVLHLITKTMVKNLRLVNFLGSHFAFVKEANFYSKIIPAIELFECDAKVPVNERIDIFIRCYGSRLSWDPNAKNADDDAIVMLDNIKARNYVNVDRFIGFDTDETLAVVKSLAKFHSLCIGMRQQKPETFNSNIRPFLEAEYLMAYKDDAKILNDICNELALIDDLNPELRDDIERLLRQCYDFQRSMCHISFKDAIHTPYTTVTHRDLWISNVMIKRGDAADDCIQAKIYDFTLYSYQSFAHDLIFFLFMSVCPIDLARNFLLFIRCYHAEFEKMLRLINCPLDDYTFEKLCHEIRVKGKLELLRILFVIKIVFVEPSSVPSLEEISPDTFFKREGMPSNVILNRWKFVIDMFIENDLIF